LLRKHNYVFDKIFLGFTEGDWVRYDDNIFKPDKYKVIKIYRDGRYKNLVLLEFKDGQRYYAGIKLIKLWKKRK